MQKALTILPSSSQTIFAQSETRAMSGYSQPSYNGSMFLSPTNNYGLSTDDGVFSNLLQLAQNHLHNSERLKQAIVHYYSLNSTIIQDFTTLTASWNAWQEEYNQIPSNIRKLSQSEDLRQIKLLLSQIDFNLLSCNNGIQELEASQSRSWRNRFRHTIP